MNKVLLDTDILSEILRGKNAAVLARANDHRAEQPESLSEPKSSVPGATPPQPDPATVMRPTRIVGAAVAVRRSRSEPTASMRL